MDLDELKQEAETQETTEEVATEEVTDEVQAESESPNKEAPQAVTDEQETPKAEQEEWLKTSEKKFTDHDVAAAKRKLKGKLSESHDKIAELEAKLEAMKPKAPEATGKPTREQFYEADDPDDAYIEALTDWKVNNTASTMQTKQKKAQQVQEYNSMVNTALTDHYSRAEKLIETAGIGEEVYKSADASVRNLINTVTGNGDAITNNLISVLGEGSEKVLFYVGRNQQAASELKSLLTSDPSGLKAVAFLAKKSAQLNAPVKKETSAPDPAPQVDGDISSSSNVKSFQKAYKKAQKEGDAQAAFNARRQAKQSGGDISGW